MSTKPFDTTQPITLPDDARAALHALADTARDRWHGVAHIAEALLSDAHAEGVDVRAGDVYAAVAREVDAQASTVRQWCDTYRHTGEQMLSEYHLFGFHHWRALVTLAKRSARELDEVAREWEASADEYGGRGVPVDVLRAALANGNATPEPIERKYLKSRERARKAVERMMRDMNADAGALNDEREAASVAAEAFAAFVRVWGTEA